MQRKKILKDIFPRLWEPIILYLVMKVWFSFSGLPMARITEKIEAEAKYMKWKTFVFFA